MLGDGEGLLKKTADGLKVGEKRSQKRWERKINEEGKSGEIQDTLSSDEVTHVVEVRGEWRGTGCVCVTETVALGGRGDKQREAEERGAGERWDTGVVST